jgi:hypothetical protein
MLDSSFKNTKSVDNATAFVRPQPGEAYLPGLYFPPVQWFRAAASCQQVTIAPDCPMVKHALQARTHIKASGGVLRLTVPTRAEHRQLGYASVQIDYQREWQRDHQRSIANYYRNSAFFEHYWPELEPILLHPHPTLRELNSALLEQLWRLLGWQVQLQTPAPDAGQPRLWLPKWTLEPACQPPGATHFEYYQLYGLFVPNLSILDLLFNEGPRARILLQN